MHYIITLIIVFARGSGSFWQLGLIHLEIAQKLTQVSHPPAKNLLNYQEKLDLTPYQ